MTPPHFDLEPLWKAQDVARYLGVNIRAVTRLRLLHELPALRISGSYRFRPSSVAAWAAEREAEHSASNASRSSAPRNGTTRRVEGRRVVVELIQ